MNLLSRLFFRSPVAAAIFTLALLAGSPTSRAAQILLNPGFETGALAPWLAPDGAPTVTNAEAHTGTFSVAAFSGDSILQLFAPVATSAISEVSFWVKRLGGPFDQVIFHYDDNSSDPFLVDAIGRGDDWIFFNVTAELDAGKNLTGIQVAGTSPGPAFLDDFSILADAGVAPMPEPATLALLGLGLAGLGFSRGRKKKS